MGGNDQWGNIVAGIDLIRRLTGKEAFGITFPLITTSLGQKMGKTEKGTVWLDPNLTTPYDYYQYWVNCDDRDVERFLSLFTFLPMDEIREAGRLRDAELNMAKAVLAYEATKIAHGEEAARSRAGRLYLSLKQSLFRRGSCPAVRYLAGSRRPTTRPYPGS